MHEPLQLFEPARFLALQSYFATLAGQSPRTAAVTITAGLALALLGLPFRRLSAAFLLASAAWTGAAVWAMTHHAGFALATLSAASVAALIGVFLPRLGHALVAALWLGLVGRALTLVVDGEFVLWGTAGLALIGALVSLIAWESMVALQCALLGGVLAGGSSPVFLRGASGGDRQLEVLLIAILSVVVFSAGLFVQLRTGELSRAALRQGRRDRTQRGRAKLRAASDAATRRVRRALAFGKKKRK